MTNHSNLKKDIKLNGKDVKTNKFTSEYDMNGNSRNRTPYALHHDLFESEQTNDKLSQFVGMISEWTEKYDDMCVIYTTNKLQPIIQVQIVRPKFKKVHSSQYKELRADPLDTMGITVAHDITSNTYFYNIPL